MSKTLREGFTTGSAATGAAMGALALLLGKERKTHCEVPLPPQEEDATSPRGFLTIPIEDVQHISSLCAKACVRKDGGDDPDATHNALIEATVMRTKDAGRIDIEGGEGVGRVTLPGLPVAVGEWAINPGPRRQLALGLRLMAQQWTYAGGIKVSISVPRGEDIARHTFNPRLGIVGGISILGTQGTVKPSSNDAWKATIAQGVHVAHATGCRTLCLATGRRSERLLLACYPELSPQAGVQVADFAEFSLQEAAKYDFERIVWGCFFGR